MAYEPTTWNDGDLITAEKMNKLEQGVKNEQVGPQGPKGDAGAQGPAGPKGDKGDPGSRCAPPPGLHFCGARGVHHKQDGAASGGSQPSADH